MNRPKKRIPRVAVKRVQDHPRPYESPLRPHLETIRGMRRAHKTWQEIAKYLNERHGLKTNFTTVYNFFRRVTERAKKGKGTLPLGYEDPEPTTGPTYRAQAAQAVPAGPAQPASAQPPGQPSTPGTSEAAGAVSQTPDKPITEMTPEEAEAEFKRRAELQRQQRPGFTLLEDDDKN